MTTIADNVKSMAGLVSDVKKTYHLTETTVMRILDINMTLHQQSLYGAGPYPVGEADDPMDLEGLPGQINMFDPEDILSPDPDDEVTEIPPDEPDMLATIKSN